MTAIVESAIYRIVSARDNLVVTLERGFPKGNIIVAKLDETVPYQKWAVINQSDGIYTFKSLVDEYGGEKIPEARRPYARNTDDDIHPEFIKDPYIRAGEIDMYTTYKIRLPEDPNPKFFTIALPERRGPTVWTIVDGGSNIIVDFYKRGNKDQLWRFERVEDLK